MNKMFNNILFIFPVMGYFALEAIVVGVIITLVWKLILSNFLGNIQYLQIVAIYWIVKMLLFDVFKLVAAFESLGRKMQQNNEFEEEQES
jgi:uncharacterized membrane protein